MRFWGENERELMVADCFEIYFLIDFIMNFFVQYTPPWRMAPVKNVRLTSLNYWKTGFKLDLIALIPLQKLSYSNHREQIFFLVKHVRMINLLTIYDGRAVIKFIAIQII